MQYVVTESRRSLHFDTSLRLCPTAIRLLRESQRYNRCPRPYSERRIKKRESQRFPNGIGLQENEFGAYFRKPSNFFLNLLTRPPRSRI